MKLLMIRSVIKEITCSGNQRERGLKFRCVFIDHVMKYKEMETMSHFQELQQQHKDSGYVVLFLSDMDVRGV